MASPDEPAPPTPSPTKPASQKMAFFRFEMKRAALWSTLAAVLRQGGSLLVVVLIARLLTPSDFGVAAIVISLVGLLVPLVQLGLIQGLVAFAQAPQKLVDSLIWLSFVLSLAVYVVLALLSEQIAALYRTPELVTLLPAGLLMIVGQNLYGLASARLQRNLDYKIQSYMAGCLPFFGIALGVPLALFHMGIWALILPQVVGYFAAAFLGLWLGKLPVRPVFVTEEMRPVLGYSLRIMLTNVMMYFSNSGTALVTGYYWSSNVVGFYNFAATNNTRLFDLFASPVSPHLFQILSKISNNKPALRQSMMEYMSLAQTYMLPLFGMLFVASGPLLRVVFGSQWDGASPYFQALLCVSAAKVINSGTSTVVQVMRNGNILLAIALMRGGMVLLILTVTIAMSASPLTTVAVLAASDSLVYLAFVPIGLHLVDLRFTDYLRNLRVPLLLTITFSLALYGCNRLAVILWPANDWILCGVLAIFTGLHFALMARLYRLGLGEIVAKISTRLRPSVS